jgi:hypothetical protein
VMRRRGGEGGGEEAEAAGAASLQDIKMRGAYVLRVRRGGRGDAVALLAGAVAVGMG